MTPTRSVLEVDWPFFGELCRGLALKVWHDYEPELVVGIARAGVLPGAVVASILRVDFASITLKRSAEGAAPSLIARPTQSPKGLRVLLVDSTCESGSTMRLALNVMKEEGAAEVRTAVAIRTGSYQVNYEALANPSFVILPWDRDVIDDDGRLVMRPDYAAALGTGAQGQGGAGAATQRRTDAPGRVADRRKPRR